MPVQCVPFVQRGLYDFDAVVAGAPAGPVRVALPPADGIVGGLDQLVGDLVHALLGHPVLAQQVVQAVDGAQLQGLALVVNGVLGALVPTAAAAAVAVAYAALGAPHSCHPFFAHLILITKEFCFRSEKEKCKRHAFHFTQTKIDFLFSLNTFYYVYVQI